MRNFDQEIKEAQDLLNKLRDEKHAEFIKTLPDIRGKYYKAAYRTFYKILEIIDAEDEDELYCDVFYVSLKPDETEAHIQSYNGYCSVSLKDEITEEEFMKWYNKAQEIIKNSL